MHFTKIDNERTKSINDATFRASEQIDANLLMSISIDGLTIHAIEDEFVRLCRLDGTGPLTSSDVEAVTEKYTSKKFDKDQAEKQARRSHVNALDYLRDTLGIELSKPNKL